MLARRQDQEMGRSVWEALPVKASLEGRGPLGAPVPDASLDTDTVPLWM